MSEEKKEAQAAGVPDFVAEAEAAMAQGVCGSLSGSVPTNVGQPRIRVSSLTVGGR